MDADRREPKPGRTAFSADCRVFFAECNHIPEKFVNFSIFFQQRPVQPGNFIVLAVGVVVAKLRIAKFVSRQKHRRSAAAQQHRTGIFDHSFPKRFYSGVVGFSLVPTVPAPVIVTSIKISPSISLIMLLVIRIKIIQGKSIMAGQEIHRSMFSADSGIIDVRRTGNSLKRCSCCPKSPF